MGINMVLSPVAQIAKEGKKIHRAKKVGEKRLLSEKGRRDGTAKGFTMAQ